MQTGGLLRGDPLAAGLFLSLSRIVPALTPSDRTRAKLQSMGIIISLARMTLLEAVRNRLVWLAAAVALTAFGLAQFLNQVAITESREIQSALLAAFLRVAAVFIAAAFVITSMVREWGDKVTELLLSLPAPRSFYFFGKFAGYAMFALILEIGRAHV